MRSRGSSRRALEAISRSEHLPATAPACANVDTDRPEIRATSVYHRHPSRRAPIDRITTRTPRASRHDDDAPTPSRRETTGARRASRHPARFRAGTVDRPSWHALLDVRSGVFFPIREREADPSDAPSFDARCAPTADISGWSRRRRTEIAAASPAREREGARVDRERLPSDEFTGGDSFRRSPGDGTVRSATSGLSSVDRGSRFPHTRSVREAAGEAAWIVLTVSRCRMPRVETPRTAHAPCGTCTRWVGLGARPCEPYTRCPDVRAESGFTPSQRARRCDASVSLGEACHGRGRRRPISAATTIVGTNRRKRGPRNDPSPRVRAAEPHRNGCEAECRGAMPDIGLPGRARCFRTALRPRMRAARLRTTHRLATLRRASEANGPSNSSRGIPPWVRWDRAPLGKRRALGVAGRCANEELEPRCRSTDSTRGSPAGSRPAKDDATSASPSAFRRRHRARTRAGSLPTRIRDDPRIPARWIAPP